MIKDVIRSILAVTMLFALGSSNLARGEGDANVPDELQFLLAQNQASFQKAAWVSYHLDQTKTDIHHGNIVGTVKKDVIQKWPYRFVICERILNNPTNPALNGNLTATSVLGQDYYASRVMDSQFVRCDGHESVEHRTTMSILNEEALAANDPFFYGGFGFDNESLQTIVYDHPIANTKWEIQERHDDGGHLFTVQRLYTDQPPNRQLISKWTFDADKGYLLMVHASYLQGQLYREGGIRVDQIGPTKAWFPVSYDETDYAPERDANGNVGYMIVGKLTGALSHIVCEPVIKEGQFTISSLTNKDGTTVLYTSSAGEISQMLWADGKLIPDLSSPPHPGAIPANQLSSSSPNNLINPVSNTTLPIAASAQRPMSHELLVSGAVGIMVSGLAAVVLTGLSRARKSGN